MTSAHECFAAYTTALTALTAACLLALRFWSLSQAQRCRTGLGIEISGFHVMSKFCTEVSSRGGKRTLPCQHALSRSLKIPTLNAEMVCTRSLLTL